MNIWSERELAEGQHTIGAGFLEHLKWAIKNGGLVGTHNPLTNLKLMPRHEMRQDLDGYIARKVRKLREYAPTKHWSESQCDVLEDVGMAALHASRRWLACRGILDKGLQDRESIARFVGGEDPSKEEHLRKLLAADAAYSLALEQRLQRGGEERAYISALQELAEHVGDTCAFLSTLSN